MSEIKPSFYHRALVWFLRLFFRLLYHSFAWSYDLVAAIVSLGRWQRWVLATTNLLTGPRILELGHGPGHLQEKLYETKVTSFGLDESSQMARQAFRRLARQGYTPRLARGRAQALPFANQSFDSLTATFPTPYIVDPATLAEIRRVLKPGGRLVVLMAAWLTGSSLSERFMHGLSRATNQTPPEDASIEEMLEPYQKAGFQAGARFIEIPGSRLLFIIASTAPSKA